MEDTVPTPPTPEAKHNRRLEPRFERLSEERQDRLVRGILQNVADGQTSVDEGTIVIKEYLNRMKMVDGFTNLLNKPGLMSAITEAMDIGQQNNIPVTLLMADGDQFKMINTKLGYDGGDLVIKCIAEAIRDATKRSTDKEGRLMEGPIDREAQEEEEDEENGNGLSRPGGDEFVVVLPDTPLEGGKVVSANIERAAREKVNVAIPNFEEVMGHSFSMSVGVVQYDPTIDRTPDDLLKRGAEEMVVIKEAKGVARK